MYFAKIDENNIVTTVIVATQAYVDNLSGTYVETDINGVSPKNYAGKGYTYRQDLNGFVPPKPFPSWSLNEETCTWDAPTPRPEGDGFYSWNEETQSWDSV